MQLSKSLTETKLDPAVNKFGSRPYSASNPRYIRSVYYRTQPFDSHWRSRSDDDSNFIFHYLRLGLYSKITGQQSVDNTLYKLDTIIFRDVL